jgi:hypothetical protein
MRGGKHPSINKNAWVTRAGLWGPNRFFSTPKSCPACRREKRIGQIENPVDWTQVLAKLRYSCAQPTLPAPDFGFCRAESVVYSFWLVVSSGARMEECPWLLKLACVFLRACCFATFHTARIICLPAKRRPAQKHIDGTYTERIARKHM